MESRLMPQLQKQRSAELPITLGILPCVVKAKGSAYPVHKARAPNLDANVTTQLQA